MTMHRLYYYYYSICFLSFINALTTTTTLKTRVQVVLLGVGDLRIDDHVGFWNALHADDDNEPIIMPMFVGHSNMLRNIPGMQAHTHDTAHLLEAALQQLQESLQQYSNKTLSYVACHDDDESLLSVIQRTVQEVVPQEPHSICIHVCDLGPADNAMGYGPYAHLPQTTNTTDEDVTIVPWKASLRDIPIHDIPEDYPSYQAKYAHMPCAMPLDVTKALLSSCTCLSTKTTTLPKARELIQLQLTRTSTHANTGLYATHWGGLPYHTVGCQSALEQVQYYYALDCQQDDALWSQQQKVVQANPNSLEHAAMQWQLKNNPLHWLPGESIIRFLSAPLLFGTISLRRIYQLSSTRPSSWFHENKTPLQSMALAREWHVQLAARHLQQEPTAKYWRYHGYLCRYFQYALTKQQPTPTEALLWIHGFGASGVQWRGIVEALQQQQHTAQTAFLPDLLGFGHSEKPALSYTGYMWESQMLDFVKEIMQHETYVVGGNSIGGYTALSLAASDMASSSSNPLSASGAPGTQSCTGLILLNSAGPVLTRDEIVNKSQQQQQQQQQQQLSIAQQTQQQLLPPCAPPPRWVGRAFGTLLLQYLRPRIESICRNLYPTNPSAVNAVLCENIRRDSLDPGALNVMMAGAKLPLPRTANELLQGVVDSPEAAFVDRPVLIAQGVLDPLNDAQDRMERFAALRDDVTAVPLQAGHCPHDELPEVVAEVVSEWLRATQAKRAALHATTAARVVELL